MYLEGTCHVRYHMYVCVYTCTSHDPPFLLLLLFGIALFSFLAIGMIHVCTTCTYIDINLIYVMYMCVHKYMECEFNFPVRSFFSSMSAASSIKAGVDHPPLPPSDCFYFSSRNQHKSDTSSILVVAPVSPHLASFPIDFLSVALHQN